MDKGRNSVDDRSDLGALYPLPKDVNPEPVVVYRPSGMYIFKQLYLYTAAMLVVVFISLKMFPAVFSMGVFAAFFSLAVGLAAVGMMKIIYGKIDRLLYSINTSAGVFMTVCMAVILMPYGFILQVFHLTFGEWKHLGILLVGNAVVVGVFVRVYEHHRGQAF